MMRKSLILTMVIAIGMISLVGFECFAEELNRFAELKIGT